MSEQLISNALVQFKPGNGELNGDTVQHSSRVIGDLKNIFLQEKEREQMDQDMLVYEVQAYFPVEEGTRGGLFFGNSTIYPGKVGNEYFMTKGHFHSLKDRAEFYWCIYGEGMLILMDESGKTTAEKMQPGSLHYIPGKIAHRVANTGDAPLRFGACWPSDAGHDYNTIANTGFSARLLDVNGKPQLIKPDK
jgi:glucose-6-phosphate isomerase, archaeal